MAVYEVWSGVVSTGAIVLTVARLRALPPWPMLAGAIVLAAISVVAGVLLWRARPLGRPLSLLVQGLQAVRLVLPGVLTLAIGLGTEIAFGFGARPDALTHHASVFFVVDSAADAPGFFFGVNLVALACCVVLLRGQSAVAAEPPAAVDVPASAPTA